MREQEAKLIELINRSHYPFPKEIKEQFELFLGEILGAASDDFLKNTVVLNYITMHIPRNSPIIFWYFLQTYSNDLIDHKIKEIIEEYKLKCKSGIDMPPKELFSPILLRSVYLSGKEELINILKKYLPIPPVSLFKNSGYEVPKVVEMHHLMVEQKFRRVQEVLFDTIMERKREWRAKFRQEEEVARIVSQKLPGVIKGTHPIELIRNASQPYRPLCNAILVERIMAQAQKVKLFDRIKHLTSLEHIQAIFDDSLYGQKTLLALMLPFRPASLAYCDQYQGDSNVICCGPFDIDPIAMKPQTIEITFDLHKMSRKNPLFFYKQRDFGFEREKRRTLTAKGKDELFFSHTSRRQRQQNPYYTYFYIYQDWEIAESKVLNSSLISYNMKDIQQILTLNFFRFIDAMEENPSGKRIRKTIYSYINELSDEELHDFLQNIGMQISDTCEVNIYGAHRIDFSTIISLSVYQEENKLAYSLEIRSLIDALKRDDITLLNKAQEHMPGVFSSYRFLDFLISHTPTTAMNSRLALRILRIACTTPSEPLSDSESELRAKPAPFTESVVQRGTLFYSASPPSATPVILGQDNTCTSIS